MKSDNIAMEDLPDSKYLKQRRLLTPLMSKKVPPIPSEDERKAYGEYHTNPISRMMFWWLNPILKVGYRRTLTENDLFYLEDRQRTETLYEIFRGYLDEEIARAWKKSQESSDDPREFKLASDLYYPFMFI